MTWTPPRVSQYTRPSAACPHPEYWTCWNAISTEVEVSLLVAALVKAAQPEFILEVGAHYGQTAERIARVIIENGHGKIISLDINPEMIGSASARCAGLPVELVCTDSTTYEPAQLIDFLFVDGSNERWADVKHFLPYMAPRSLILVHDTGTPPVNSQVEYILAMCREKGEIGAIELDSPRGFLMIKLP